MGNIRGGRRTVEGCVPDKNVSTLNSNVCGTQVVCWRAESDKAETSLTESTLYVRIEECLSVSCNHHSAAGGKPEKKRVVVPFDEFELGRARKKAILQRR